MQSSPDYWSDTLHRDLSKEAQSQAQSQAQLMEGLGRTWWEPLIVKPLAPPQEQIPVTLEGLLMSTLEYSAQVQVIKEIPLIRETSIMEADSEFDWLSFIDTRWLDTSEPVGSRLTTGGPERFRDHHFVTSAGIRRKNTWGGQFEISQQLGHQDNNSVFFVPGNQGTSRLTLGYTQPLLRGAGRPYNTSLTLLAQIDAEMGRDEFIEQLQTHILEVSRAYWDLYLERGNLLQKRRLYHRAADIHQNLNRRRDIDALRSQIVRARAAVEGRRADIVSAAHAVRNAESRIRSLVNDPSLGLSTANELIPALPIQRVPSLIDVEESVQIALQNRPEMGQAIKQIRAAGVRLNMSKNELLPVLNVVIETYASGLRGNSNIGGSIVDQFRRGEPSYSVGLQYEFPMGNRAAQARYQRRRHELRQLEAQLRATMESLRLQVEVAVRDLETNYRKMQANFMAMKAAEEEVAYVTDRWLLLAGNQVSASLLLEDLLDAQERLNASEFAYLSSQVAYNFAHMNYQRAVGTLLQAEGISIQRYCESYLPTLELRHRNHNTYPLQSEEIDAPVQAPVDVPPEHSPSPRPNSWSNK